MIISKILLLEDDEDDQLIFRDALRQVSNNIECITSANGLLGLDYLFKIDSMNLLPDIIFIDFNMPLMNGFEFLEAIKKTPQLKHIPAIIFSTSKHPQDKIKANALGAEQFITKFPDFRLLKKELATIFATMALSKQ